MSAELKRRVSDLADDLMTCKTEVGRELEKGNQRMNDLGDKVDKLSLAVEELGCKISLMIDIFEAGEKFFRVIGWTGKMVKSFAVIGIAITAFYYFVTTGSWHK